MRELAEISAEIHRCVGVVIDRRGRVVKTAIGDAHRVHYPNGHDETVTEKRLSGLRFIHTSFRSGELDPSELVQLSRYRLDAMVRITVDEKGRASAVSSRLFFHEYERQARRVLPSF